MILRLTTPAINGLVSVILPFFREEAWLAEAIESVIAQTDANWELILVNDGATPGSIRIAERYRDAYPAIALVAHPGGINSGVAASRNLGIRHARGEYLAFLDADDRWLPVKLSHQLKLFGDHPATDMICEASIFWRSWNGGKDEVMEVGAIDSVTGTRSVLRDQLHLPPLLMTTLYPLGNGAAPCPSGIIIRRRCVEKLGGFQEEFCGEFQLYEDQAFLSKVYLRSPVYISAIPNNLYRKREGSLSSSASDLTHYQKVRTFFLTWLEQYVRSEALEDDRVTQLINHAKQITGKPISMQGT